MPGTDDRLRALDPSPASARPRVAATAWGEEMRTALTAGPSPRAVRRRARRTAGVVAGAVTAVAIAALMTVLLVSTGGDDGTVAGAPVVLVVTPAPGGVAVRPADLDAAAAVLRERAAMLGVDSLAVAVQGDTLVVTPPESARADLVSEISRPGRLVVLPSTRSAVGSASLSLDKAVGLAQADAGLPMRGGGESALPPGYRIVREDIPLTADPGRSAPWFTALKGPAALTGAAVASARPDAADPAAVTITFTDRGVAAFGRLTRTLAQDGALRRAPAGFVVVFDGVLVAAPTVDYEQYPVGLDGRSGLVVPLPETLDPAVVAALLTTGPLPVVFRPEGVTVASDTVLRSAYMGVNCRTSDPACDRVGLSVTLPRPARSVVATFAGQELALDDPTWSGPATGGLRTIFAGFIDRAGLRGDGVLALPPAARGDAWIGDPEVRVPVRLVITGRDGGRTEVTLDVRLSPGWG